MVTKIKKCRHENTKSIFKIHPQGNLLFECLICGMTKNTSGIWDFHLSSNKEKSNSGGLTCGNDSNS